MSRAVKAKEGGFDIDFQRLQSDSRLPILSTLSRLRSRLVATAPPTVSPHLISLAIEGVMRQCTMQLDRQRLLLWNEYKIFLAEEDFRQLQPLQSRLSAALETKIAAVLQKLRGETVGEVATHLTVDEERPIPRGFGHIEPSYRESTESRAAIDSGTMTVRISPRRLAQEATQRLEEPTQGALRMRWAAGTAMVAAGGAIKIGRPHEGSPPRFVALTGADRRISRHQLTIENDAGSAIVTRPSNANPVAIGDRLLQAGGKMVVSRFPMTISLSNGALEVVVELEGGA